MRWKRNNYCIFWVCICTLRYPAGKAHAPCCHLWPVRLYNIFAHYLPNGTIFKKKMLLNIKCVLIFYTMFVWNISHSKKNEARYDQNCVGLHVPNIFSDLMKIEFSPRAFKKYSSIKFHEDPPAESRVDQCGQTGGRTDRHDETNSRFSKFC